MINEIQLNSIKFFVYKHNFLQSMLLPAINIRRRILKIMQKRFQEKYASLFDLVENESLIVKIPNFSCTFELDIRSHLLRTILRTKLYEPNLVRIIDYYLDPNKDVLDIGANVGFFTVLFSYPYLICLYLSRT